MKTLDTYTRIRPQGGAPLWHKKLCGLPQIPTQPFLCATAGPLLYSSSSQLFAHPAATGYCSQGLQETDRLRELWKMLFYISTIWTTARAVT